MLDRMYIHTSLEQREGALVVIDDRIYCVIPQPLPKLIIILGLQLTDVTITSILLHRYKECRCGGVLVYGDGLPLQRVESQGFSGPTLHKGSTVCDHTEPGLGIR